MIEFRKPELLKYEPREFLPFRDGELVDVSSFTAPQWVIKFEYRRTLSFLGRTLYRGSWIPMQRRF